LGREKTRLSVDYPIVIAVRDEGVQQELKSSFVPMGFECRCTGDAEGALGLLRSQRPWLVVTELGLARDEVLLETIKEEPSTACVAVVTGAVSGKEVARIVKAGATEVFEYPRDRGDLLRFVDNLGLSPEEEETTEFQSLSSTREKKRIEEKKTLVRFLNLYGGNVSATARRMGCTRGTIYQRMRKFEIQV